MEYASQYYSLRTYIVLLNTSSVICVPDDEHHAKLVVNATVLISRQLFFKWQSR